jgi:signal transduction histidine kinase
MKKHAAAEKTGLQFYGEISSSISHEVKNYLAIINENAGLLEDLTIMADEGGSLDPERLKMLAVKIKEQIQRINEVIQRMNRFAHSAEESEKKIDLNDIVEFVIALSERFAFIRGIVLNHEKGNSADNIITDPFSLENLIWCCLEIAMEAAGENKTVTIISESNEGDGRVSFTQLDDLGSYQPDIFNSERIKGLINSLNADLKFNGEGKEIILTVKKKSEQTD